MTPLQKTNALCCALFVAMFAALILACLCTGCSALRNGIDAEAHIRPAPKDEKPAPPPAPKPDPYDWEPWWNRPPKPKLEAD